MCTESHDNVCICIPSVLKNNGNQILFFYDSQDKRQQS